MNVLNALIDALPWLSIPAIVVSLINLLIPHAGFPIALLVVFGIGLSKCKREWLFKAALILIGVILGGV